MYFRDEHGRVWIKEGGNFRNVGLAVKEKVVTFKKIESVKVLPGEVVVPSIAGAIPLTVREAISKLGITEDSPLKPLKNLEVMKNE